MKHLILMVSLMCTAVPARAGEDDVDQFFTDAELREALGANADEIRRSGALTPGSNDQADDEDANDDDPDVRDAVGGIDAGHFVTLARGGQGAPVWGPFTAAFRQCAPGCVPANYNVYRRGRHTCHAQGRAIDVGAIICGGTTYPALRGGRFAQVVQCMQNHLIVLYREHRGRGPTRDHHDHAHFSIGCVL